MDESLDIRLREIRSRLVHSDALLAQVVNLTTRSELGIQLGLSLLLGSVTVQGVPVPSDTAARELDQEVLHYYRTVGAIAAAAGADEGRVWRDIAESIVASPFFATTVAKDAEDRAAFFEGLNQLEEKPSGDLLDLPEDLRDVGLIVMTPPRAVTLEHASIRHGAGDWEAVGTMRVVLHQVQAWWTFRLGVPDEAHPVMEPDDEEHVHDER